MMLASVNWSVIFNCLFGKGSAKSRNIPNLIIFDRTNGPALKDHLLIEALRNRDKVAFDYIFNYYYSALCAFSMQYVNDHDAVEDLVQDLFVSLWKEAPKLQIQTSLKAYLFTSVKNRCFDFRKHKKVTEKYQTYFLFSSEGFDNSADHNLSESELRQTIQKSLEKLSPRCREIFELSRLNNLSNKDISEKLEISKRTVELQISNALKIFRKELADFLQFCLIALLIR
jgi:RNA polymerase sigma-70 factor, ECF subfamily